MKLLVITQKMDRNDPVLGFFHNWVIKFAEKFEYISVICLEKGNVDLPKNASTFSLGKEDGASRIKYLKRFFGEILKKRNDYDAVFVHMNQEYILLAGWLWKIFGKKVYMWRNHHSGSIFTDVASMFCENVFCTSKFSYTAKYKKTILMPVGIDLEKFKIQNLPDRQAGSKFRVKDSILFLGRVAPVKRPDLLIKALGVLKKEGVSFHTSIYGDALPEHWEYKKSLSEYVGSNNLLGIVEFFKGVPNDKTPEIYNRSEIFVNLSTSGMYDKTIFEAMACGCLVLASNENLRGEIDDRFIFKEGDLAELTEKLENLLKMSESDKLRFRNEMREYVLQKHSLTSLGGNLYSVISK